MSSPRCGTFPHGNKKVREAKEDLTGEAQPHNKKGEGVIGREPREFCPANRIIPFHGLIHSPCQARREIQILDDESSAEDLRRDWNGSPGEIKMLSPNHIDSGLAHEESEVGTYPGVEIQELVSTVAVIQSPIHIRDSSVTDRAAERCRNDCEIGIGQGDRRRRDSGVGWP